MCVVIVWGSRIPHQKQPSFSNFWLTLVRMYSTILLKLVPHDFTCHREISGKQKITFLRLKFLEMFLLGWFKMQGFSRF